VSSLFVVSTPIGNLEDLTRRAERVLREADHIAAEDTRRTGLLLKHLEIRSEMVSLHEHNEASRVDQILGWLGAGESVALVTDAGTPLVSDPGGRVVQAVAEAGFQVVPIPGPSAVLAALAGSGLPVDRFVFLGFPPRKGRAREDFLARVGDSAEVTVLFESPERTGRTLADLARACGEDRRVVVARELTKLHEEFRRGTAGELAAYYSGEKPRGEVTLVVDAAGEAPSPGGDEVLARARTLLEAGDRPSGVARTLARELGISRNEAYAMVQEVRGEVE
jgi:16S rRNA (cytidine1402-2'-O)-methyltransferase